MSGTRKRSPIVKAILFSALLYPGLGQMVLKRKGLGYLFSVVFSAGVGLMVYDMVVQAMEIVNTTLQISDMQSIPQMTDLMNSSSNGGSLFLLGSIIAFACWAGSIAHVIVAGSESRHSSAPPPENPDIDSGKKS